MEIRQFYLNKNLLEEIRNPFDRLRGRGGQVLPNLGFIQQLINAGADVNTQYDWYPATQLDNDFRNTPLMFAAYYGYTDIVRLLLEAGADVNFNNGGSNSTALMYAARGLNRDIVRLLIEAGADVNVSGRGSGRWNVRVPLGQPLQILPLPLNLNWTALMEAANIDRVILPLLIPPLDFSYSEDRIQIVRMLLNAGADVNATDTNNWTADQIADATQTDHVLSLVTASSMTTVANMIRLFEEEQERRNVMNIDLALGQGSIRPRDDAAAHHPWDGVPYDPGVRSNIMEMLGYDPDRQSDLHIVETMRREREREDSDSDSDTDNEWLDLLQEPPLLIDRRRPRDDNDDEQQRNVRRRIR